MKVRAGVALAATGALLTCAGSAQAARPASLGAGVPVGQNGVQLYDWSNYLSNGAGEITCPAAPAAPTTDCVGPPAPTTTPTRLTRVFAYLQSKGVRNVELYAYPGNPFPTTTAGNTGDIAGLQALRALGDQYGLRFPSRHGNIAASNWDNDIKASKILGQEYIGAADPPSFTTLANALNTAQLLNQLGKRSVDAGLGPLYFHNHAAAFSTKLVDNGVTKTAEDVLLDHTDSRYVKVQFDLFWLASGLSNDNTAMLAEINKYGNRIVSVHMKDGVTPTPSAGTAQLRELGNGVVDFSTLLAALKNKTKYYYYEYDPVTPGQNGGFNPFTSADTSLANMQADPAPALYAPVTNFPSVPANTAAADNQLAIPVTNKGDAPLTITTPRSPRTRATPVTRLTSRSSAPTATAPATSVRWRPPRPRSPTIRRRRPTRLSPPSRPAPARSTSASSRSAPTTTRSRACSSPPTVTTASTSRRSTASAPTTRSAPWAATCPACWRSRSRRRRASAPSSRRSLAPMTPRRARP